MKMKRILINLTEVQIEELGELVKNNTYHNRSEAVRDAIRQLLEEKKLTELNKKLR
jgi:metal-responsive CopG/Arc/MetJ family transcriptional regulator